MTGSRAVAGCTAVAQPADHRRTGRCPRRCEGCVDAGLAAIGVWREQVAEVGLDRGVPAGPDAGLRVSSLCRGGFFTTADAGEVEAAEARQPRGDRGGRARSGRRPWCWSPGGLPAGDRDLAGGPARGPSAIERLVPYAPNAGSPSASSR